MTNQNGKLFATNYCQRRDFKKILKKFIIIVVFLVRL